MLVTQSCPPLCKPMNCSQPGSSVHGILQARILNCVAVSFSRGFSWPMDRIWVSCIAGGFFGPSKPPGRSLLDKRVYQPDLEERERERVRSGRHRGPRKERREGVELWDGLFSVDVKIEETLHHSRALTKPSYVWGKLVPGMLHSAQHNSSLTTMGANEKTYMQMKVPVIRSWASMTLVNLPLRKVWGKV